MYKPVHDGATQIPDSDTYSNDGMAYSEDDIDDGRPSAEVLDGDRGILEEEDERERLLMESKGIPAEKREKGDRRKGRRRERKRRGGQEETSQLMYEMEEGVGTSNSSMSRNSSESDEQRLLATNIHRKVS
jgi:hypothetical protein